MDPSTTLPLEENPLSERSTHVPFGNWMAGPFTDLGLGKIIKFVVPKPKGIGNLEGIACSKLEAIPLRDGDENQMSVPAVAVSMIILRERDSFKLISFPATRNCLRTGLDAPPVQ